MQALGVLPLFGSGVEATVGLLSGSRPPDSFQLFRTSFALPSVFIFSNPFFNNP